MNEIPTAATIAESIHGRDFERLRGVSLSAILAFIESIWEREAGLHLPDFDELFNAGYTAKNLGIVQTEHQLKEWLKKRDLRNQSNWDVAGCFLVGYWPARPRVDEELFGILLRALEIGGLQESPRDTLIVALSHAFHQLEDEGLTQRMKSLFHRLWSEAGEKNFQPLVMKALNNVLKIKDALPGKSL